MAGGKSRPDQPWSLVTIQVLMIIQKKQTDTANCAFNWTFFRAARHGLKAILEHESASGGKILLPAYIGYSSHEGSGVFDPVREVGTPYLFYRLTKDLQINFEDISRKIKENPGAILLLIHYFGFQDKQLAEIKKIARANNMLIVEDFAHAFFTFWHTQEITFDYGIFSLHKLFPLPDGGALLSKEPWPWPTNISYDLLRYNFRAIAEKRRANFGFLLDKLAPLVKNGLPVKLLHESLGDNVPQSFPLLLNSESLRDDLYFRLNESGFGLVSLYHELIKEIDASFDIEHEIARRIINLPIHQDADPPRLSQLLDIVLDRINDYSR